MSAISVKGVVIGGIVDVASSFILGLPFAIFVIIKVQLAHTPVEQVGAAVKAATFGSTPIYLAQLAVGTGCSVLGGYVAARVAKHHELLNGALASILCVVLGIYVVAAGKDPHPMLVQALLVAVSPALSLLGGYLRLRQSYRLTDAPPLNS
jgi:hypothetical protein